MNAYQPTIADFPVRPPLRAGESLAGWCWRFCRSNGHDLPRELRSAVKGNKASPEMSTEQMLAHFLGADLLTALRAREYQLIERWDPQCAVKWHTWSLTPRLCPACIKGDGYHHLLWDLPLVSACPLHRCLLAERCQACGLLFTWRTLSSGWRCTCGKQVSRTLLVRAPEWATRLADLLVKASDAQIPPGMQDIHIGVLPNIPAYRTQDLYGMLWWALKLRRALTEGRSYPQPASWPVIQRQGARMVPGAWEMGLIGGSHSRWQAKAHWLLRWCFRSESVVLVDLRNLECYRRVSKLVTELEGQTNPLAVLVREAIQKVFTAHSAGIPQQQQVFFHPTLRLPDRQTHIKQLAAWWRSFASMVPVLDPADGIGCRCDSAHQPLYWFDGNPTAAVALLNIFFEAAHKKWAPSDLGSVVHRWHLPVELHEPKDVLREVGEYLTRLHRSELEFVQTLVRHSITEQAAQHARTQHHG